MILVSNRIQVHPDYHDEFEATFSEREGRVDEMEGFVSFHILRPHSDDAPYVVQTRWESKAHFDAWTSSDAFRAQHGKGRRLPEGAVLGKPQIEIHEIIQKTEATVTK